jgi:predicted nucleotidyltransferase
MADLLKRGLADLLADKREAILQLAANHKAYNVRVFGSVARGEATSDSDVDFLVDFQPDYTLWDHMGLIQDLSDLLGRQVDVSTEAHLRDEFRPDVMRDIVAL